MRLYRVREEFERMNRGRGARAWFGVVRHIFVGRRVATGGTHVPLPYVYNNNNLGVYNNNNLGVAGGLFTLFWRSSIHMAQVWVYEYIY